MALTLGRYVLGSRIAAGGMGEVFHANQTGPDGFSRPCVVKTIQERFATEPELIELFLEEARLSARLNHSNIAQVYDFGKVGESYYMAMEFVDGPPLRSVIKWLQLRGENLDLGLALRMVSQAAQALDYAHRVKGVDGAPLNIIHRDISPANLLLSKQGLIKVIDFGIARARTTERVTQVGVVRGNVSYMAPEQVLGLPLDGRADVFGLGLVLYECLTLKRAQRVKSMLELARAQYVPIEPVSALRADCPEPVAQIVARALERKRELRFQTAGQMAQIIEDTLASLGLMPSVARLADLAEEVTTAQTASPSGFFSDSGASGSAKDGSERGSNPSADAQVGAAPLAPSGPRPGALGRSPPGPSGARSGTGTAPRASPSRAAPPRAAPPVPDPELAPVEALPPGPAPTGVSSNELPTQLAHIPSLEELRAAPTPPPVAGPVPAPPPPPVADVEPPGPAEAGGPQGTILGPVPSLEELRAPAPAPAPKERSSGSGGRGDATDEPTNAGVRLEDVAARAAARSPRGGDGAGGSAGPTVSDYARPSTAAAGSTSGGQRRLRRAAAPSAAPPVAEPVGGGSPPPPPPPSGAAEVRAGAPLDEPPRRVDQETVVAARPSRPAGGTVDDPRAVTLPVGGARGEATPVGPPPEPPEPDGPARAPQAAHKTLPEVSLVVPPPAAPTSRTSLVDTVPPRGTAPVSTLAGEESADQGLRATPGGASGPGGTLVGVSSGSSQPGELAAVARSQLSTDPGGEPLFGSGTSDDETPQSSSRRLAGTRTRRFRRRTFAAFAVAMMISGLAFGWFLARCAEPRSAVAPVTAQ